MKMAALLVFLMVSTAHAYLSPTTPGGGGSGTVTSVGLSLPALFTISGSPVTTTGTLTGVLATQTANTVFSGPASGSAAAPTFRALTNPDAPAPTLLTKAANYTITTADVANNTIIYANTSGGAFTLTFPSPSGLGGKVINIFDSTGSFSTHALTMARSGSEMIQGLAASLVLSANWGNYSFQTDGTNWFKVNGSSNAARVTLTSSGTWTAPAGVTQVIATGRGASGGGGGGASGGGGSTTTAAGGGAGGGAGGAAISNTTNIVVVPGTAYTITIGAGGAGGAGGAANAANAAGSVGNGGGNAGSGGTTTFGALMRWNGGFNGVIGTAGAAFGTAGSGGSGAANSFGGNSANGGNGGAANATGNSSPVSAFGQSVYANGGRAASVSGGAAGGTGGGGGGGAGGAALGGDFTSTLGTPPVSAAGGASGADGNAGTVGVAGTVGSSGWGGPGGGGGGLKASTGSVGGAGTAGTAGTDGAMTIQWWE